MSKFHNYKRPSVLRALSFSKKDAVETEALIANLYPDAADDPRPDKESSDVPLGKILRELRRLSILANGTNPRLCIIWTREDPTRLQDDALSNQIVPKEAWIEVFLKFLE